MLNELDLSVSLDKQTYREQTDALTIRLGELQRKAREEPISF